jgi:hypothetical protein
VAGGGSNARQRARMTARLASRAGQKTLERADDDADKEPRLKGSGRVEGSAFDWETNLYIDPDTKSLYDGGDLEARDIREALAADWKMRQLAELLTGTIKGATWKLVPGKGDTGEAADTEEKLRRPSNAGGMTTPMGLVIAQAASARIYRRAYFAKGFKLDPVKRDGSVMYSQLAMRPASTCRPRVDPVDGSFDGFVQEIVYFGDASGHGGKRWDGRPIVFAPRESVVFFNGLEKDPVSGVSDLEVAMWCFRTKRKVMALWLTFLAAQALPRTLVKYTGGDEPKALKAAEMIASLSSGGVGYIDSTSLDVAVLDGSGKGPAVFKEMAEYLDTCQIGQHPRRVHRPDRAGRRRPRLLRVARVGDRDVRPGHRARRGHDRGHLHQPRGRRPRALQLRARRRGADVQVRRARRRRGRPVDDVAAGARHDAGLLAAAGVRQRARHSRRPPPRPRRGQDRKALDEAAVRAKKQAEQQAANPAGHQAAAVNGAVEGLRGIAREVTRAA